MQENISPIDNLIPRFQTDLNKLSKFVFKTVHIQPKRYHTFTEIVIAET